MLGRKSKKGILSLLWTIFPADGCENAKFGSISGLGELKIGKVSPPKIHDFFHFLLVYKWKMKKSWFFGVSQLIFDEKPLNNHDFWNFVVAENAKNIIFDWFLCKKCFFEKCHSSILLKKQCKIMIFEFRKFPKMQKHYFFHCFLQKMKILTSQHLDGQKKKNSGMDQVVQKCRLTPFFDMPR